MSKLLFDGRKHQILFVDATGNTVGTWAAYNNVDSHATIRHLPNGTYSVQDQTTPHPHAASANGPYGLYGIIRFNVPGHTGIGVHSGRANARYLPGPQHPTKGCIRTSDDAMREIREQMHRDPITAVEVKNNDPVAARAATERNRAMNLAGHAHG